VVSAGAEKFDKDEMLMPAPSVGRRGSGAKMPVTSVPLLQRVMMEPPREERKMTGAHWGVLVRGCGWYIGI
jgi:hypothetical protein